VTEQLPPARTRVMIAAVALCTIALELALMRMLSVRFWSHFAYMVISVAILGFGASGTVMTLLRTRITRAKRIWMFALGLALGVSIPATWAGGRAIAIDVQFLAWDFGQLAGVVCLEALMLIPFFLSGMLLGIPMMDRPRRISAHYAANLLGAGAGAVAGVTGLFVLSEAALGLVLAGVVFVAAILLLPARLWAGIVAVFAAAAIAALCPLILRPPVISQYKMLSQVRLTPGSKAIHSASGPLGRIDVVEGPGIHFAPALGLQYTGGVPPHVLLIVDGDQTSAVYDSPRIDDWAFMDQTTSAIPYHLRSRPSVCIIGAGGGADIGLAIHHRSRGVIALEMNGQIIDIMTSVLRERGGAVYLHPDVAVLPRDAREYFAGGANKFDVIQLPSIDAFGASGAGLYATQESYLHTVETFSLMWNRLSDDGLLVITRWGRTPPRDALKVFDTAAEMLRSKSLPPGEHLAMIRNWATATVLVSKRPLDKHDTDRIAAFCEERGFDLCYFPGLDASAGNRYHVLDRPYYFEGCRALLGAEREAYLDEYLFEIAGATDDRPYFHHFFRWRSLPILSQQLGRRSRAFAEMGYLMLLAALVQAVLAAGVLIVLPLAPGVRSLRAVRGKGAAMGYFLAIGAGFMLLEMGFLQKLILYLGHPIYSAAVVIAGFLIFAGTGSLVSRYAPLSPRRLAGAGGLTVAVLVVIHLLVLDGWVGATQSLPMGLRMLVASATVAPLGFAMGFMLPSGMRSLGVSSPALVPWAWAVNGFASVVATVAAPLLAMRIGFANLILTAAVCYLAAAGLSRLLPPPETQEISELRAPALHEGVS